jgi:hypothetical protein
MIVIFFSLKISLLLPNGVSWNKILGFPLLKKRKGKSIILIIITYRFWSFDENFGLSHFVLPFLQVHMSEEKSLVVDILSNT